MVDTFLVPPRTVVDAKGDSAAVEVSGAANRVFLLNLEITNIVEQESLDLSIYSSADGATCRPNPGSLRRKERDASRVSPRSFAPQRMLAQDDNQTAPLPVPPVTRHTDSPAFTIKTQLWTHPPV